MSIYGMSSVIICIAYSTIETIEVARIGYNGFFPHQYSGEVLGAFHIRGRIFNSIDKGIIVQI